MSSNNPFHQRCELQKLDAGTTHADATTATAGSTMEPVYGEPELQSDAADCLSRSTTNADAKT